MGKGKRAAKKSKSVAKREAVQRGNGSARKPELRKPVERGIVTKRLPVAVGAEIVDRAAHEMARLHTDREALKSERRETMAEFKERLASMDQRMTELADTVNKSTELRDVKCKELLYVEENRVDVVRIDSGEVVESRTATAEDRQEDLGLQEREARGGIAPAAGAFKGPGEVGARQRGGDFADDEDEGDEADGDSAEA